ncbi:AI-2E family transporter [Candidatus Methylospira mobilis]|uniref:AI-2E family transporter n=1 Tax=Candidatus Methylospira mobilis TaxID=1808979 RepID=A0A5Q0BQF4_9GAMM|nr:AI-2E family transporter [Candidatus Methylospira mobilis]QFY44318.1 AI-2E family transporter [Candidatus Methylospira mobilis]WNV06249.1 AI-2E family transporter [Candidatus Methylospira mobilis]
MPIPRISSLPDKALEKIISRKLLDLFIRVGLIGFLVVYCYQIFRPFIGLMLWALILAVALYPLHALIARKMGGRQNLAATTLVLVILLGVLVPATLLAISFADSTNALVKEVQNGTIRIPAPVASVAQWPMIGEQVYAFWSTAYTDIGSVIAKLEPKIGAVTKQILAYAASAGVAVLMFLVSLILAGVLMAHASSSHAAAIAIAKRMTGPEKGGEFVELSTATIRAVAQGVIGIACIQALLLGAGFMVAGVPAAGILALLVLLISIVQIPAMLITAPVIVYVFYTQESTTVAVIFTVYSLIAGSVDNVLKPLMLGRGVNAPMPVILLGALGGMAGGGIIGLFLGAVMLTLGYQLFMAWVHGDNEQENMKTITED